MHAKTFYATQGVNTIVQKLSNKKVVKWFVGLIY